MIWIIVFQYFSNVILHTLRCYFSALLRSLPSSPPLSLPFHLSINPSSLSHQCNTMQRNAKTSNKTKIQEKGKNHTQPSPVRQFHSIEPEPDSNQSKWSSVSSLKLQIMKTNSKKQNTLWIGFCSTAPGTPENIRTDPYKISKKPNQTIMQNAIHGCASWITGTPCEVSS